VIQIIFFGKLSPNAVHENKKSYYLNNGIMRAYILGGFYTGLIFALRPQAGV